MYTLIGIDGKEYGPINEETLRYWIAEGRADGTLKAKTEGTDQWKLLSEFPEFAEALAAKTTSTFHYEETPPTSARIINSGDYELNIGRCLQAGWLMLQSHFWLAILGTILQLAIQYGLQLLSNWNPTWGTVVLFIFCGVINGAQQYFFLRLVRGNSIGLRDIFSGFSSALLPLCIAGAAITFFVALGIVLAVGLYVQSKNLAVFLLVLPSVYLAVAWSFTFLLIADKKMPLRLAIQTSRKMVNKHWWKIFSAFFLFGLVGISGAALFIIGILLTLPVAFGAFAEAYEQIFSNTDSEAEGSHA